MAGEERLLNQDIRFMRNKDIFESKDAAIAKINTIPQKVGQPLAHLYKLPDGITVKCFLTIGLKDDMTGPDAYQIIANDIDLSDLTHYTNEEPLVKELGGLKVGQTFKEVPLKQMWTDLLYPYIEPLISLGASVAGGVKETGTSLAGIIFTATTTKKSKPIKGVKFFVNNSEVLSVSSPKPNGGAETYTNERINANTTVKAQVSDDLSKWITSNQITYTFVYPAFVGKLPAGTSTPTSDDIKGMTKKVQSPGNITNSFNLSNERMCIATPPGWTLRSIIDPNGFNIFDSFQLKNINVVCTDGKTVSYNVYISEPTAQTGFNVTFNR